MDNSIAKLLGEDTLPPELVISLQEAYDKKVAEVREEAEVAVREELSRRYEHDKANLVEAMDRMLTDVVQKHEADKNQAVQRFTEARSAFRKAVKEARTNYATKLNETLSQTRGFVSTQLSLEMKKLREQKKALVSERLNTADKLETMKGTLAEQHSARLAKIDEFVVRQVKRELSEFNDDHRALVKTRVKLVSEARHRLKETQARFVREAAKNVEKVVTESLKREMTQLHEDLEANRQNMFGRRIFEAMAAEYMTSYLAEGTEIRKLQKTLESKETALSSAKFKLDEAVKEGQQTARKARLAEDRAVRSKTMSELLSNLRGEKRTIMEGMLETVKTDSLRNTFNKLLPVVLDETTRKSPSMATKKPLNETRPAARSASVVTGNNRTATRLYESVEAEENEINDDIAQVVRLAGIQK